MTPEESLDALAALVIDAAAELRLLGEQPLAIASAYDKFNDAFEDDYWSAVQLGWFNWEQSQFFQGWDGRIGGTAKQHGTVMIEPGECGSAEASHHAIKRARAILKRLDDAKWHELAETALGAQIPSGILAVVIQFDQVWLHCSSAIGTNEDQILALVDGKLRRLAPIDDRFDELIGRAELIRCDGPDPELITLISSAARTHFDAAILDREAARELALLLNAIAPRVAELANRDPVAFRPRVPWSEQRYRWQRSNFTSSRCPRFVLGDEYFDREYFQKLSVVAKTSPMAAERRAQLAAPVFTQLEAPFRTIDEKQVRDLFEQASGTHLFDSEDLYLLFVGSQPWLAYRDRLHRVNSQGIDAAVQWRASAELLGRELHEWIAGLRSQFEHSVYRFG